MARRRGIAERLQRPWRRFRKRRRVLNHLIDTHLRRHPTDAEKRERLLSLQQIFGCRTFVETGTFLGETALAMATHFDRCYTIEIDERLYERARELLAPHRHVKVLLGDSGARLAEVLKEIDEPALFWLDAHYSGGFTGRGAADTPILAELRMLLAHPVTGHVVLIDDARCFLGDAEYPSVRTIAKLVKGAAPHLAVDVYADTIRIYPSTYAAEPDAAPSAGGGSPT